jgi:hypothetical protein
MPPGGYGFGLQDDKNDGVIYLIFGTQAEAEDARKLVAEAFAMATRAIAPTQR